MLLSAVTAAAFGASVGAGILTYIACLCLFLAVWRGRVICEQIDRKWFPVRGTAVGWKVLLKSLGTALVAIMLFCTSCSFVQVSIAPLLVSPESAARDEARFVKALWVSMAIGTAVTLGFYWLVWPARDARTDGVA